ncbi:MAG: SAM-dependent methyltransferase, partial [Bdellovibrionia bacterium]
VIIDRFIEQSIKEGVDAVINLGAGLDTRPYRMSLPESLEWIEVDYPNIIAHKNELLKRERPKCKLTRVAVDLTVGQKRKEFFDNVVPQAKKVLILTEGVIPYLSPEQVTELSTDLLAQQRFTYWITEYFHKKVYRILTKSIRTLKMKNAPFKFYPEDWFAFFKNLGWVEKETRYTAEIAVEFNRKPPMPWWAEFIMFFISKKMKEESLRLVGYVIFKRDQKQDNLTDSTIKGAW